MTSKALLALVITCSSFCAYGCNDNAAPNETSVASVDTAYEKGDSTGLPAVETKKPNADYKPAFAGQSRIGAVKTSTSYTVVKLAEKIGFPWAIIPMPGNRFLTTDKTGYMQIIDANGKVLKKITG